MQTHGPISVPRSWPILHRQPSSAERPSLNRGTFEFRAHLPSAAIAQGVTGADFTLSTIAPAYVLRTPGAGQPFHGMCSRSESAQTFEAHAGENKNRWLTQVLARYRFLPADHDQNVGLRSGTLAEAERIASFRLERMKPVLIEELALFLEELVVRTEGAGTRVRTRDLTPEAMLMGRPYLAQHLFDELPWLMLVTAWQDRGFGRGKYAYMRGEPERVVFAELR